MLLTGNYYHDARVKKECGSLSKKYIVDIYCISKKTSEIKKETNTLTIYNIYFGKLPMNKLTIFIKGTKKIYNYIVKQNVKYDLVWANDIDTLKLGYLLKKKYDAKLIYDSHELWYDCLDSDLIIQVYGKLAIGSFLLHERKYISKADYIFSTNDSRLKLLAKRYNLDLSKLGVLHNYPQKSQIVSKIQIQSNKDNKIKLIYYGVLKGRGIEKIITAMGKLRLLDKTKLSFVILGSEKDYNNLLLPIVKRYDLESIVKFKGFVLPEQLKEYESKADFGFLLYPQTNLNNIYAAPNKLYTNLANGCLVITNTKSLSNDIGKFGFIVNDSIDNIIKVLVKIVSLSKSHIQNLKREAIKFSNKNFVWEENKLFKILKKL